jgi:hypothetical protein
MIDTEKRGVFHKRLAQKSVLIAKNFDVIPQKSATVRAGGGPQMGADEFEFGWNPLCSATVCVVDGDANRALGCEHSRFVYICPDIFLAT